eukprot:scaffold9769_cov29-Tisochrysis_lutea.AAC.2
MMPSSCGSIGAWRRTVGWSSPTSPAAANPRAWRHSPVSSSTLSATIMCKRASRVEWHGTLFASLNQREGQPDHDCCFTGQILGVRLPKSKTLTLSNWEAPLGERE